MNSATAELALPANVAAEPLERVNLQLSGLYCAACAGLIEAALRAVPGVREVSVNASARLATVAWPSAVQGDVQPLIDAVRGAGYTAWVAGQAGTAREQRRAEERRMLWRLFVAAFCMMQVMMLAAPEWLYAAGEIEPDMRALLHWGAWVMTLPVVLLSAAPFFAAAWQAARRGRVAMDTPVAIAVAVTFLAGTVSTFDPRGAVGLLGGEVYFDSLTMFITFLLAGRWLELRLRHRAQAEHEQRLAGLPQTAQRVHEDGTVQAVALAALRVGDRLLVARGEPFAADGQIVQGQTYADESLLSGESQPVPKACGAEVLGGSVNVGDAVQLRVLRVGQQSCQGAIEALMHEAATLRPHGAALADRYAGLFITVVLALALLGYAAWQFIDPARALWVAVAVLIVTCPCALSLAVPSALLAASQGLHRRQVVVRRLAGIERLAQITHVLLDKTGTLTLSQPVVQQVRVLSSSAAMAERAASLALWSQHPKARAVARWSVAAHAGDWQSVHETPGAGLQAVDGTGQTWRLGSAAWVGDAAVAASPGAVVFGAPGRAEVVFEMGEALRADAREAVAALQQAGLQVELLSGDDGHRVQAAAQALGLPATPGWRGEQQPQDKLARVQQLQAQGAVVAMVGDGLNDGPAFAAADVSLAMAQGSALAQGQADALIVGARLMSLAQAHALALRCRRVVRGNLRWALAYNLACVPLALAGALPPWAAGLGMAASSAWVVWRAQGLAR
jgi:P-type Cu2+ transporter